MALLEHSEAVALPLQQRHIEEFRAAEAPRHAAEIQFAINQVRAQPPTDRSESPCTAPSAGPSVPASPSPSLHTSDAPEKRGFSEVESEDGDDLEHENARSNPKPKGEHYFLKRQYSLLT